ncbi:MAG: Holliday junction resolvase RuvX [Fimbriimonadaceae bacterium]
MRLLGIDLGRRRIGVAVAESELEIATPRSPLRASGKLDSDADAIARIATAEAVAVVVVGVPEMEEADDGGRMQRACRELGARLSARGLRVEFVDEAFTSVEADLALRQTGLTAAKRKARVDGEAAARILERYMSERGRTES